MKEITISVILENVVNLVSTIFGRDQFKNEVLDRHLFFYLSEVREVCAQRHMHIASIEAKLLRRLYSDNG
ncbi:MAG TPA: hypothetical protein DCM31_05835 [Deferribacteraceae bacterium]|nr:hypothetical protein [Deferribacteraceae bacterium]